MDNERPHRVYPWGDEKSEENANYDDTGIGTTSAVGCFPSGVPPMDVLTCPEMCGNGHGVFMRIIRMTRKMGER